MEREDLIRLAELYVDGKVDIDGPEVVVRLLELVRGTPGEDTVPEPVRRGWRSGAPPEPVCTTCGNTRTTVHGMRKGAAVYGPCPDCWHGTPGEHADGEPDYPLIDWRKANREQWERGTPGEDAEPAEPVRSMREYEERYLPNKAAAKARAAETPEQLGQRIAREALTPAEPVCPTCNGNGPYCRPVGDLPEDTGNQP